MACKPAVENPFTIDVQTHSGTLGSATGTSFAACQSHVENRRNADRSSALRFKAANGYKHIALMSSGIGIDFIL
jgi:hypothetical protein